MQHSTATAMPCMPPRSIAHGNCPCLPSAAPALPTVAQQQLVLVVAPATVQAHQVVHPGGKVGILKHHPLRAAGRRRGGEPGA